MKKLLAISSLALAALAPLSAQAVGTLYMSPAKQDVAVNDVVSVDVFISGLGNEIVSSFDLNVLFSSTILSAGGSVVFNEPILGGNDSAWDATFGAGDREVVAYSLLTDNEVAALQGDDPLKLFTMTFSALTDGVTKLNFGPSLDFERNVVGRDASSLQLSYEGACVAVGTAKGGCDVPAIPEPSTYALMLLGLGIVGAAARSKKRA